MPSRSLCVHPDWIETVQQAYESAYLSSRCPNQKDFVDRIPVSPTQVGLSIDTLNNFRKGEPVDKGYFHALCDRIGVKAEQVALPCRDSEVDFEDLKVKEIFEENFQELGIVEGTGVNKVDHMNINGSDDETACDKNTDSTERNENIRKIERNFQSAGEVRAGGILINKANKINYHSGD